MLSVEIVVPVYNGVNYVTDFIDSYVKQKNSLIKEQLSFSLTFIDDGSTDDTQALIEELKANRTDIRLVPKEHSGVSATRTHGINVCEADYLMFLDCDDPIDEHLLKNISNYLANNVASADVILMNSKVSQNYTYYSNEEDLLNTLKKMSKMHDESIHLWVNGNLYKKSFIQEHGLSFYEELRVGEDLIFNFEALLKANVISESNIVTHYYSGEHSYAKILEENYDNELFFNKQLNSTLLSKNFINQQEVKKIYNRFCLTGILFLIKKCFITDPDRVERLKKMANMPNYKQALNNYSKDKKEYKFGKKDKLILNLLRFKLYNSVYKVVKL